jgi:hypothetical protein
VHSDRLLTFCQPSKDTARAKFEHGKLTLTATAERFGWSGGFQHVADLKSSLLEST